MYEHIKEALHNFSNHEIGIDAFGTAISGRPSNSFAVLQSWSNDKKIVCNHLAFPTILNKNRIQTKKIQPFSRQKCQSSCEIKPVSIAFKGGNSSVPPSQTNFYRNYIKRRLPVTHNYSQEPKQKQKNRYASQAINIRDQSHSLVTYILKRKRTNREAFTQRHMAIMGRNSPIQ